MQATKIVLLALVLAAGSASADHTRAHTKERRIDEKRAEKAAERDALKERKMTGRSIADRIMDAYRRDALMAEENLGVVVAGGEVTLSGAVSSLYAKERAQRIAENVRGVSSVKNKIAVRPQGPFTDRQVTRNIQQALRADPATSELELTVVSTNGVTTISGSVPTIADEQLALRVAKDVFGVRELKDEITIEQEDDAASASDVEEIIGRNLEWDATVDADAIDVRYRQGKVTLSGTVASAAARRHAIENAWVEGVTSVDASALKVDPKATVAGGPRAAAQVEVEPGKGKLDDAIKTVLEQKLQSNPRTADSTIRIEVEMGLVTLRGDVDSLKAKREATRITHNTYGVLDVKNRLRVDPTMAKGDAESDGPADEKIESALGEAFQRDPLVSPSAVEIEVVGGEVYLEGKVDSVLEKIRADDLAARTVGVTLVHNELEVAAQKKPTRAGLDDEDALYVYDWYEHAPQASAKSDREIKDALEAQLFWSPAVDEAEISVKVDDGFVKLEGSVDSWAERQLATENAYEAGAVWVENDLEVRSGT